MTDKELLQLAAKVSGIMIRGPATKWIAQGVTELDLLVWNDKGGDSVWNPLTDDGDALRLAVKLDMDIVFDFDRVMVVFGDADATCITEYFYELPKPTNRIDATRRAIVRAAAEIGKEMK